MHIIKMEEIGFLPKKSSLLSTLVKNELCKYDFLLFVNFSYSLFEANKLQFTMKSQSFS